MTPTTINWLHLSDWHQITEGDQALLDRKVVVDRLAEYLKKPPDNTSTRGAYAAKNIDFIVFSGDVANSGKPKEYERAKQLLDTIKAACIRLPTTQNYLFMVPGNHDFDDSRRAYVHEDFRKAPVELSRLAKAHSTTPESIEIRESLFKPFNGFSTFAKEYAGREDFLYGYLAQFVKDDVKIAIVGLNTALFCRRPNEQGHIDRDEGRLQIGENQLLRLIDGQPDFQEANIRVATFHHPLNCLNSDKDRSRVEKLLTGDRLFDFLLSGHEHEPKVISHTPRGYFEIQSGALFTERDTDDWHPNSCQIVSMTFEESDVCAVSIHSLEYSDRDYWEEKRVSEGKKGVPWKHTLKVPLRSQSNSSLSRVLDTPPIKKEIRDPSFEDRVSVISVIDESIKTGKPFHLLYGFHQMGKTEMLKNFPKRLHVDSQEYFVTTQVNSNSDTATAVLGKAFNVNPDDPIIASEIAGKICRKLRDIERGTDTDEFEQRFYLFLDNAHLLTDVEAEKLRGLLSKIRTEVSKGVSRTGEYFIVLIAILARDPLQRPWSDRWGDKSTWNLFAWRSIGSFKREDVADIVVKQLRELPRLELIKGEVTDGLLQHTSGIPFLVSELIERIKTTGPYWRLYERTPYLEEDEDPVFVDLWSDFFRQRLYPRWEESIPRGLPNLLDISDLRFIFETLSAYRFFPDTFVNELIEETIQRKLTTGTSINTLVNSANEPSRMSEVAGLYAQALLTSAADSFFINDSSHEQVPAAWREFEHVTRPLIFRLSHQSIKAKQEAHKRAVQAYTRRLLREDVNDQKDWIATYRETLRHKTLQLMGYDMTNDNRRTLSMDKLVKELRELLDSLPNERRKDFLKGYRHGIAERGLRENDAELSSIISEQQFHDIWTALKQDL